MTRRKRPQAARQPDMTPMIDVTFLLLVFFIVTLNIRQLEGRLDAALPKDRGMDQNSEQIEKTDILVFVIEPGELVNEGMNSALWTYEGRRLRYEIGTHRFDSLDAMQPYLASLDLEAPLSLDLRKGTTNGDAIALLDRAISLGFQEISFAGTLESL
jgi:biopolymer transport protein ExbD